jgi:hypothetical protein
MKQSKKGISLAFVIVVVMALMIFSAMLFSAASHSLSMTGTSTEGRQAYLTAKSAIEYAKTLAYDKAKSGGKLVPFSVGHDADGNYAELAAATAPNGTDCYAECTNPGGDGKNWKILAKVKYQNSGQYRQLVYTFALHYAGSSGLATVNSYVNAGPRRMDTVIVNPDHRFSGQNSIYPAAFETTITTASQSFAAPEMYFLNSGVSLQMEEDSSVTFTLNSNIIFFNGSIKGNSTRMQNKESLILTNTAYNKLHLSNGYDGIVWFHNTIISNYGKTLKINDGAYYFKSGVTDLFDIDALKSGNTTLKLVPAEDFKNIDNLRKMNIKEKVAYYQAGEGKVKSSEAEETGGAGWTAEGKFKRFDSANPPSQAGNDVYIYTQQDRYNGNGFNDITAPETYIASGIAMQYMGTQDQPFTIPKTTITFQTDAFWLNGQSRDGYPADDNNDDDMPAIQGASSASRFLVRSLNGSSDVTLILPHGLVVKDVNGNVIYKFDPRRQAGYDENDSSTFTFTVPSGTDLLSLRNSAGDDAKDAGQLTAVPAGSSGSGGFTISGGKYADS